jgi:hypothetical protein
MGDISGRPKAPAPQVVYVPQYIYANTAPAPAPAEGGASKEGTDNPVPASPEQQREKTLLGRSRSRVGTILTGFRGILAPVENQDRRKTLLGE